MKDINAQQETLILFENIYTVEELQLFYDEIDKIISSLYIGSQNIEEKITTLISPDKKEHLLAYFKNEKVRLSNPVEIQGALSKIKKLGDTIPVVSLELAFEPTEQILKNISLWFLRRIGKKVFLLITLERRDIGGAYISYNGLYKDYTLNTKIDKYFAGQKSAE